MFAALENIIPSLLGTLGHFRTRCHANTKFSGKFFFRETPQDRYALRPFTRKNHGPDARDFAMFAVDPIAQAGRLLSDPSASAPG